MATDVKGVKFPSPSWPASLSPQTKQSPLLPQATQWEDPTAMIEQSSPRRPSTILGSSHWFETWVSLTPFLFALLGGAGGIPVRAKH